MSSARPDEPAPEDRPDGPCSQLGDKPAKRGEPTHSTSNSDPDSTSQNDRSTVNNRESTTRDNDSTVQNGDSTVRDGAGAAGGGSSPDVSAEGGTANRSWLGVFLGFARIGSTSFGGGSATIVAMRQLSLKRGWLTEDEFLDTVVLSRLTPGITILAQAILIGRSVSGVRGLVAALVGMMLPSVVITVALAAVYDKVSTIPSASIPLRAVAGMAAGFAVALALQLLRDTLARSHRVRGPLMFVVYLGFALLVKDPVVVLVTAIVAGVAFPDVFRGRGDAKPEGEEPE
jgi:chromate transporter